ncbi:uncharacterized protein N7515_004455 [Penicillium bovifimosum]|uniref:ARID domain-containing protein n=1 Tax=Penicillium bovifimosum TaxID=126998 RepID=A0A9W9H051_9EURO|nr:uncharacterized protein N7515_004455 [Penicillium bovifimosum]KAJ5135177.1 hypothetical protein N7515_004455 [Penicillium bovifimosum]
MNAWLADASNIPGQDNGAFHQSTIDPSTAFLRGSPTPQDPSQFQRMFNNGVPRNASPGFHNPNQVIPSKRARPEDGMPMSPRPAPGGITGPRSQTPHQVPYPGYQGPPNGNTQFQQHPTPYQHLQQGASPNVTQSPIMQDFDQQSARMGTASPSPFSPAGPHPGPHMSPSQSDHGSRVNTPQNANFMQAQQFGGMPQGPGMTSGGPQPSMQAQQFGGMPQLPHNYHQALANQQQRLQAMQQQARLNPNAAMAGRPGAINQIPTQQQAVGRMGQMPQNMQSNMAKSNNPETFLRNLQKFMMSQNLPLDLNPMVAGRHINLFHLYATVMKMGGSKKVTGGNMWPVVAHQLSFPQMQYPTAAQEVQGHYSRNLAPYEQAYLINSHQKQMDMQQQQPGGLPRQPSQFQSPSLKSTQGFEQAQAIAQSPHNSTPVHHNTPGNAMNGFATPTHARSQSRPAQAGHRPSVSRTSQPPVQPTDAATGQFVAPSPSQSGKGSTPVASQQQPVHQEQKPEQLVKRPIGETFKPMVMTGSRLHGPIIVDEMYQLGDDISRLKPGVPTFAELGLVDLHALTMALKSGITAEVRVALDTLTTLSGEPSLQLSLESCDDLVESLVDCAEDQVDFLAEHTTEDSDTVQLRSYAEVIRDCQSENTSIAEVPEFGSIEYELDRAVDRLICVTTILRNFSFSETNFSPLGIPPVAQLFSDVFRYMGTRKMFLRTSRNTLDMMKDGVILLSNLAHAVQIPGKEEALNLLTFLLAFSPEPTSSPSGKVMFTAFNSSVDRYTPAAVDGLAKMLARDDPNRTYFKAIFSGDGSAPAQPELLTRAFGLAISCVPDKKPMAVVDARKVFLMQGLLSADVLTTFADGTLAKAWLESVDGFAVHLLRLSCALCTERIPQINVRQRGQAEADAYAFSSIVNRGLGILRRLAEKSKQLDNSLPLNIPSGILPRKESLLGALLLPNIDGGVVRQLLTYARLAE